MDWAGETTTNVYEHRLTIVRNIPKLPATEYLTVVDNYDSWNTKMRRFFGRGDTFSNTWKYFNGTSTDGKARRTTWLHHASYVAEATATVLTSRTWTTATPDISIPSKWA